MMLRSVLAAAIWVCTVSTVTAENWPQFRGADARGVSNNPNLPSQWSATENIAWKCDLPGRGWSSPVVWEDRVFLTSVLSEGPQEEQKKGIYFGGERPMPPEAIHAWLVICVDLETGKILWQQTAHQGRPQSPIHLKNTYASETPATDGQRVFAYFGNVGVFSYDMEGRPAWSMRWGPYRMSSGWGTGASPVVDGDRLYLVNDNEEESFITAIDSNSGQEVWRTPREDKSNWATPFVWHNSIRTEIITSGSGRVCAYDIEGKLLWQIGHTSNNAIPTPFADGDLLYVCSGHPLSKFKPILQIRAGASGDITLPDGQTKSDHVVWCQPVASPYNPTPLLYDGRLYVLLDGGFFACIDAANGELVYSKKRIPDGRAFTASPWGYDGHVFCLNEDGVTFVIEAGPEFKVLRTNPLAEDDMCLAMPAIVGDRLLIRSSARLYCIQSGRHVAETRRP